MKLNKNSISKAIHFLTVDIWRIRLRDLSKAKAFLLKQLRVILLAFRGFTEDKCQLHASALTFYSLLSIVPVVAMAFGVAKGFGFETMLQNQLMEKLQGQEEVATQVIAFSQALLENTKGGLIAGIGIAILIWTVIKVLGTIENSFNDIWGIRKARSLGRKFSDYLSIMLIAPILFIMSSSVTVAISSQIVRIVDSISFLGAFAPIILASLKLLPFAVIWILFTFIYMIMPNTKVKFPAALAAGIVAGTVYQLVQWIYITFQIGVAKFNAIYGSFAALPLFLVWLQLSWRILLLGAEVSFSYQNEETYEFEQDCLQASYRFKRLLTLRIMHILVRNFVDGDKPLDENQIAHSLDMPIRLVRQLLFELSEAGLVSEVKGENDKLAGYQPARDVDQLTIQYIMNTLEQHGIDTVPVAKTKEFQAIAGSLKKLNQLIINSDANLLLKDVA